MQHRKRWMSTGLAIGMALMLTLTGCQNSGDMLGAGGDASTQSAAGDKENENRGATNGELGGAGDFDGGGLIS